MTALEQRMGRLEDRVVAVEQRMERLDSRMSVSEQGQARLEGLLDGLREAIFERATR